MHEGVRARKSGACASILILPALRIMVYYGTPPRLPWAALWVGGWATGWCYGQDGARTPVDGLPFSGAKLCKICRLLLVRCALAVVKLN